MWKTVPWFYPGSALYGTNFRRMAASAMEQFFRINVDGTEALPISYNFIRS